MANLAGLHDIEAVTVAPPDSWIVDTIALSENPTARSFPSSLNIIARLNWGYGSTGTIPLPAHYGEMAVRAATYVAASSGCRRWIIGNEPNLPREWPDHEPIFPWHYAACFSQCREAIHAIPGHQEDEVLLAGSGPWNNECKYDSNKNGDWVRYFTDCCELLGNDFDGFALHAYTHGYDKSLVTSTARMDAPFQNRYYHFRTYQDYCDAISLEFNHLPCYITEANGDGSWVAAGLMPEMLREVDNWNRNGFLPEIQCVAFFRYPADKRDGYGMADKPDVMQEYSTAYHLGLQSPSDGATPPVDGAGEPEPTPPAQDYTFLWDTRLDMRGTELVVADAAEGQQVWHITVGEWFNEEEAQGRINCYIRVKDKTGALVSGVPVRWFWSSGEEIKPTEIKSDPWLGGQYSLDFPMYVPAPAYGFEMADGLPSDVVTGLGLGSLEQPNYNIHTCYLFEIQRQVEPAQATPPTPIQKQTEYVTSISGANLRAEPVDGAILVAVPFGASVLVDAVTLGSDGYWWKHSTYVATVGWIRGDLLAEAQPVPPLPSGGLVHPLPGSVITQNFYENPHNYAQFDLPGHDGTDFGGLPYGTPILSIADGVVKRAEFDAAGYGNFVEVEHSAVGATTIYAHASALTVEVGQVVKAGDTIALLGSSGNSTGVHLHLSARLIAADGSYVEGTPMRKGRVDARTWAIGLGLTL